jgi:hypothetical protein
MTNPLAETSPSSRGRILAALYLLVIVGGIVGQAVIADQMIVRGDPAKTAANILGNMTLYRLAFSIFMVEMIAQFATTALFYDLLKPVNRSVARIMAILGFAGSGFKTMARLFFYMPLILLGQADYFAGMQTPQLEALSMASIRMNSMGASIGLIFFGCEGFLRGWLVYQSGFLPRFLGVLSIIASVGWMTWIWPPLGSQTFTVVAVVAILGVFLTAGWLFIRGVDDAKWRERAALAATSIWR